ncbi:MAG: sulfatase [Planctomycetes bacterium]|nr:sulfatase [Planctomycetota bacterium]
MRCASPRVSTTLLATAFYGLLLNIQSCQKAAFEALVEDPRPNVIIIFTDDQGYGDVGVNGAQGFETPNLDKLAAEGIQLTDFYVAPVCTPSRAQLMTGRYAHRMGLGHRVLFPYSDGGLAAEEWTMAEAMQAAGYRTGMIGKWHLGHKEQFHPMRHGFDEFYGVPYSNDMNRHYYKHLDFQSPPLPLYRNEKIIEEDPPQALLTMNYTFEAKEFIRRNQEMPFFLYLAHNMPHQPIAASSKFSGHSELGLYGDVIEEIDWSVGSVMQLVDDLGLAENTIIIFTSDNGPWRAQSSGGLRGKKGSTWEGGMRVPCFIRWPGVIPAGSSSDEMTTSMDLLPTLAAWTRSPAQNPNVENTVALFDHLDGDDIRPLLTASGHLKTDERALYYYRDNKLQAVRQGRWKLHVNRPEWNKLDPKPSAWLFDMRNDRNETTDVAADHADVVAALLELIEKAS